MSLLNEPPGPSEESSARRSPARYLLVGASLLIVAAVVAWALWPAPASAPRSAVTEPKPALAPVVTPTPVPEPLGTAAPATPVPRRPRKKAEPVVEAVAPPSAPTTGTLKVESDVAGASVFIDREFKGAAPLVIEGVTPGSHQLNVSAEGYQGHAETIEVGPGPATIAVRFKEVKLNETVPVVHKHTIGSCHGRLVADTQGIRYETSNKDDAFSMTHAEVESIEADYLKKNLRIKRRGGKTYNFTNESADALFVFQKNVQAARARLAKGDPAAK